MPHVPNTPPEDFLRRLNPGPKVCRSQAKPEPSPAATDHNVATWSPRLDVKRTRDQLAQARSEGGQRQPPVLHRHAHQGLRGPVQQPERGRVLSHVGVLQPWADERAGRGDARQGVQETPGRGQGFRGAGGRQEGAVRQLLLPQRSVGCFSLLRVCC